MFQDNLLNGGLYGHAFLDWRPALQVAVESRSAHLRQMTHSLDAQAALQPRLGFHRRRLLARDIALLASSLDFLQGTSEKIYLNRLVRQYPLQLTDFLTKCGFSRIPRGRLSFSLSIRWVHLIPPLVQQSAMNA
jgi:hypothetical protein